MANIVLTDFHGSSVSEKFTAAIEFMQKNPGTTLFIPKGEYILTSELARKQMDDVLRGNFGRNPQDEYVKSLKFNPYNDLYENKWYYVEVLEATVTHNYWLDDKAYEYQWEDWK